MDFLMDALKDAALSLPILFIAYLAMEALERSNKLSEEILNTKSKKLGPLIGGLVGIIPQCGISGAAATLFSTGAISVGTMLAVFFSTSDEMLPILLTSKIKFSQILYILILKAGMAILFGYIIDIAFAKKFADKNIHAFCETEHCSCENAEGSIWHSAFIHTVKIGIIILIVNLILNLSFTYITMPTNLSPWFLALFGLIPNCSVSVIITEAYLNGIMPFGAMIAGLMSNSGIGLLVLYRTNKNFKENFLITATMYLISGMAGSFL